MRRQNIYTFQKEIGNTETMRTACAAWSNTVKYRPENPRYIIFGIQNKKEDRFYEDMFLYMLVQSGGYQVFLYNPCCPVSQQQNLRKCANISTFVFPLRIWHFCTKEQNLSLLPMLEKSIIWCFWYLKLPRQLISSLLWMWFCVVRLPQMWASVG